MEDTFLVTQTLKGQQEAFRLLVVRYQRPLFRFLRMLGFQPAHVEDLAQLTFLRAYRSLNAFEPSKGSFSTWLFTIAKRLAAQEHERSHHRHEVSATDVETLAAVSDATDPAEAASVAQRLRHLEAALRALPDGLRSTFLLSQIKELTLEEVAEVEGCAIGTVKSRIHRAREQLRLALLPKES